MSSVREDYRTSDLYLAAFLKTKGLDFLDTRRVGGKVYFIFEYDEDISEMKRRFFNRTAEVPALDYADELKAMKSLCHE